MKYAGVSLRQTTGILVSTVTRPLRADVLTSAEIVKCFAVPSWIVDTTYVPGTLVLSRTRNAPSPRLDRYYAHRTNTQMRIRSPLLQGASGRRAAKDLQAKMGCKPWKP